MGSPIPRAVRTAPCWDLGIFALETWRIYDQQTKIDGTGSHTAALGA